MRWDFARELAAHGPGRAPATPAEGRRYCAHVAATSRENFAVASVLVPRTLLPHVRAVYAYCRWADDLADETPQGDAALELLQWWRSELNAVYDGAPRHPVMVALQDTVRRFGVPRRPFLDLLSAFEQDQRRKEYATFDDLLGYCRNSANPVGRLVLYLFESHDGRRGALADQVCTGLQLANFWQDVARDAALGRVYLPRDDRERFGVTVDDLRARRFTPGFRDLLAFQVGRTRGFFDRGAELLPLLRGSARSDVELFIGGGVATLDAVEACGHDVLKRRPTVSKRRRLGLLAAAAGRRAWGWATGEPRQ